jgi:hypothetical protein
MRRVGSYNRATASGTVAEEDLAQARAFGQRVAELAARIV